jgi:alanine dehydrogenase
MSVPKTIGFPRMMKEPGEKRVFLPEFIQFFAERGMKVFIEEGYGSRSGYTFADYRQGSRAVRLCTRPEAFQQDVVMVLRSPLLDEFKMVRPGNCLISMLHYPTRPKRVAALSSLGINAISLDSIANDSNLRLVENMKAVAWNGLEAAFDVLEKRWPGLKRPDGEPIRVLILGTGMIGKHAVDAATKLGNIERNNQHMQDKGPGVVAMTVGRNLSSHEKTMEKLFRESDLLVDATQRRDPSQPVVPNAWLAWLPEHAVVADLAVDPYTLDTQPPVVRGIEGIPQGNLDKYTFLSNDADWDKTVPASIPSRHRRAMVSCYSWPGIHPESCMRHYAQQLEPLMEVLLAKGYDGLALDGGYFERALYRATLRAWLQSGADEPPSR